MGTTAESNLRILKRRVLDAVTRSRIYPQRKTPGTLYSMTVQGSWGFIGSTQVVIQGMGDIGLEPMTPSVSSWCSSQLS